LLTSLRGSDTVSRQGGDEFVILLSELTHATDAATSAKKILQSLNTPHSIDQQDLHIATAASGSASTRRTEKTPKR
jgi:GGDEF domain-containing protein